jgi:hypothetical protein
MLVCSPFGPLRSLVSFTWALWPELCWACRTVNKSLATEVSEAPWHMRKRYTSTQKGQTTLGKAISVLGAPPYFTGCQTTKEWQSPYWLPVKLPLQSGDYQGWGIWSWPPADASRWLHFICGLDRKELYWEGLHFQAWHETVPPITLNEVYSEPWVLGVDPGELRWQTNSKAASSLKGFPIWKASPCPANSQVGVLWPLDWEQEMT